ncbi:MAG TPA: ATP-dependent DNA helicase [Candidatus Eremiobacteraceae bacterium]
MGRSLIPTIEDALGPDGLIARCLPGYELRPAQVNYAKRVQRGMLENIHVMAEAGTGTGKSFGYLVPALLSGERLVVSTATIALQEQLLTKDIPLVLRALSSPARVVQLKGRSNYLCKDKIGQLYRQTSMARSDDERRLFAWAEQTETGDRAELDFVPAARLWSEVDTDADDCIMEACEFFGPERCHHMRAREAARHADIVVVNHALFFLNLAMGGGLIPPFEYAVLDEAHQIDEWATAAFSSSISRASIGRLQRKLARYFHMDVLLDGELSNAAEEFSAALGAGSRPRYPLHENDRAMELLEPLQRALYRVENWVASRWRDASRFPNLDVEALERRRDLLVDAVVAHTQAIERMRLMEGDWISWAERQGDARSAYAAISAPAVVAPILRARLFDETACVVMTSATIATGHDFSYLRRQVGLTDAPIDEIVVESPFDYARQAMLYLPPARVNPKSATFAHDAARIVCDVLDATNGRAFVLFTSHAVMRTVASIVAPQLSYPSMVQGDMPKGRILDWFRAQKNPVLFATASFWEGVDVVGDALSCVIIDRIPFPPPDDPVLVARAAAVREAGGDPFNELSVPAAIMRLKQGLGRLIRSASDIGLMCVLDGRLETMPYGRRILAALPPARRVHELDEVREFLRSASTSGE